MTKATKQAERTKTAFDGTKRGSIFWFSADDLVIPTDKDDPLFDPRGLEPPDEKMIAGIRTYGILQPIAIRKDDDGKPVVIAGRRRVLACRQANKELKAAGLPPKLVPAVFRHEDAKEALPLMVIENSHRLEESLTAKADKAKRALSMGYTEDQVAEMFSVSAATIQNWAQIANLHKDVRAALDDGSVRLVDAIRTIGRLPKTEQPAALKLAQESKPTRKVAKQTAEKEGRKVERTVSPAARLKKLSAFVTAEETASMADGLITLVAWLNGEAKDGQLAEAFPDLAPFFEAKAKGKKAA